jgi:diguanylate cyclase (GGDEF)-like protein
MQTRDAETGLYTNEHFRRRLAANVEHAERSGLPYSIVACVPQLLPGEAADEVVQGVATSVRELVRRSDLPGCPGAEIFAVGLPETAEDGARALGQRLQSELSLRSAHVRSTKWEAGVACLPEDGLTSGKLLQAAIEAARTRRRRLAS